jgi:hypothetical protein
MRGGDYSKNRARTLRRGLTPTVTHAIPYVPVRKGAIRRELMAFVAHGHCAQGFSLRSIPNLAIFAPLRALISQFYTINVEDELEFVHFPVLGIYG